MLSTWIKMHFLMVMSLAKGICASLGSTNSHCACYTFDGTPRNWWYGRQQCRSQGGDLVSMETVEEWEFIKRQIQNRTTGSFDEWWIGLERRDGRWTWPSNQTLTYDKWQPGEPSMKQYEKCVFMAKNYPSNTYGLFNDAGCNVWKGWICENKRKGCSNDQVKWCKNPVAPTVTKVPKTDPEATATTITTSDFALTDSSTNTPYSNKPTQHASTIYQHKTTPLHGHKEIDDRPITSDHPKLAKAVVVNTDCLPYPLLVTAIFVCVLGGLTVLATVAFFLVPLLLKNIRSRIV